MEKFELAALTTAYLTNYTYAISNTSSHTMTMSGVSDSMYSTGYAEMNIERAIKLLRDEIAELRIEVAELKHRENPIFTDVERYRNLDPAL